MSEQQFAASLDAIPEKPQFELDDAEPQSVPQELRARDVARAGASRVTPVQGAGKLSSDLEAPVSGPVVVGADLQSPQDTKPDWRSLVSAKVSSYKARKPYTDRYPSLQLQFDQPARRSRELQTFAPIDEVEAAFEHSTEVTNDPIVIAPALLPDLPPARVIMEATARVIEFPRPAEWAEELAEPMIDRPRIVEAPELLPPPPAMGGILIEEQREAEPERRPGFDVPLQSAPLNRRVMAGLFDAALVLSAVALFGYVFIRMNGAIPPLRSAAVLAASLMGIFWPAYQYAFLVYCGRTPGLWAAKLQLARFDGHPVSRGLRRWRVIASLMSLGSLGLGYAWTFLDEDQLSWHDRITRTHMAPHSGITKA